MRMAMYLQASARPDEWYRRRARVLAYRLAQGEMVKLLAEEAEVLEYLGNGFRVEPGCAGGIVPGRTV